MRIPTLIILIAFAHFEAVAQAQRWLSYQPAIVELDGRLITEQKYGPPNFGEEQKTDKKLTVPILVLNEAINVRGTPGDLINGESVMGAKRVQLVFTAGVIPYTKLIGKDVVVKGKLFHSHTGHHFTDVLVDVGSIEEAPCPNAMSQFEINQCIGNLYKRSDKEMNEVYNRILAGLKGDDRANLVEAQRAWLKYRDANCFANRELFRGGSIAPAVHAGCLQGATDARTQELIRIYETEGG